MSDESLNLKSFTPFSYLQTKQKLDFVNFSVKKNYYQTNYLSPTKRVIIAKSNIRFFGSRTRNPAQLFAPNHMF